MRVRRTAPNTTLKPTELFVNGKNADFSDFHGFFPVFVAFSVDCGGKP
jgi:hypothetical protein